MNCWDGVRWWWEAFYFLCSLFGIWGFECNQNLNPQTIRAHGLKLHLARGQRWTASEVSSDFCGFCLKRERNPESVVSSRKQLSQQSLNFSFVIEVLSSDSIDCGRKFSFGFWLSIAYQCNVLLFCEEGTLLLATTDNKINNKKKLSVTPHRISFKLWLKKKKNLITNVRKYHPFKKLSSNVS